MADHVFSPALLQRLKQTSIAPNEVLVVVDRRLGVAAGVDPVDATKVRIVDGCVRAIGKQLIMYDAFDVGAFVCGPALFDGIEMAVAAGDSSVSGAIQVLADAGVARVLPIVDDEWWFDVDTPRITATAAAICFEARESRWMAQSPRGSTARSRSG